MYNNYLLYTYWCKLQLYKKPDLYQGNNFEHGVVVDCDYQANVRKLGHWVSYIYNWLIMMTKVLVKLLDIFMVLQVNVIGSTR